MPKGYRNPPAWREFAGAVADAMFEREREIVHSQYQPETDRLAEIELGFIGHPEDDYYFVEAKDFAWLIAEVKRLREAKGGDSNTNAP